MQLIDLRTVLVVGVLAFAALTGGAFEVLPALTVALIFALVSGWVVLDQNLDLDFAEWTALATIVWGGVVACARGTSGLENKETLGMWMAAFVVWLSCRRSSDRGRRIGFAVMFASSLVLSLGILLEAIGQGQPSAGGFFANPNIAAALILPTLAIALFSSDRQKRSSMLIVTAVLLGGASVTLTGSRAAAVAIFIMLVTSVPAGRLRKIMLVGAAVTLSLILIWRFTATEDSLKWHRTAIWSSLAHMVVDHPVMGCGPGGMVDSSGPYRIKNPHRIGHHFHRIGSAESTPLGIVIRLGGVGLAICLIGIFAWLAQKRSENFFGHPGARTAFAAMFVFIIVHDQLPVPMVLWWWAALIGLMESRYRSETARENRPQWVRALVVTSIVLWLMVQPAYARSNWLRSPPTPRRAEAAWRIDLLYLPPLSWRVHDILAQHEWNWATAAEALYWSNMVVTIDPGKSSSWSDHARLSARITSELGSYPDSITTAREAFDKACGLEPHLPWAWLDWAIFERSLGQGQYAQTLAKKSVEAEPNFCRGWLFLARTEIDKGDINSAKRSFDQALRINRLRPIAFTTYERRLVRAPAWQFEELRRILGIEYKPSKERNR